jgi:hypothetical protein
MTITVVVVVTAMMAAHHNWRMMMAGISAVVSVSAVTRYALFRDHYWPIRRSRSSKRGTGEKNSDGQCSTGEHQCFFMTYFPRLKVPGFRH